VFTPPTRQNSFVASASVVCIGHNCNTGLPFCLQIHQRELADNLKLRERQVEIEVIGENIKVEEQRLDGLNVNNLMRERDSLNEEMTKLIDEVLLLSVIFVN